MRIFSRALDAAEIDQRAPRTASKGNGMFQHRMCSGGCAVILVALIAAGCCSDPWRVYPEHTAPDRTCSTGSVAGYDVYIWDCLRGQHVVVAQWSGEMSCRSPVQERSACGTLTPLESTLALTPAMCAAPRSGRAWVP